MNKQTMFFVFRVIFIIGLAISFLLIILQFILFEPSGKIQDVQAIELDQKKQEITKTISDSQMRNGPLRVINFDLALHHNLEFRFQTDHDLYNLALELLDRSKQNDGEAQYYLGKVLVDCVYVSSDAFRDMSDFNVLDEYWKLTSSRCSNFTPENILSFSDAMNLFNSSDMNDFVLGKLFQLLPIENLEEHTSTLSTIHEAIDFAHPDAFIMLSRMTNSVEKSKAWELISCDFGGDCTQKTNRPWITELKELCNSEELSVCNSQEQLTFYDYVKLSSTTSEFDMIMKNKELFLSAIQSSTVQNLKTRDLTE